MKFVDVTNDVAFRKIFGNENKTQIVISFLNAVLKLDNKNKIVEVEIVNPYQLPRVAGEKASIIDVRAKDIQGRQFIVEMQVANIEGFDKRVQYYTCRDYAMQINVGEQYKMLKPTYFIAILDFNFFDSKNYLSHHIILNGETYEHTLKDIQFTFIELKKFHIQQENLNSLIEKWTFFIKNAENLEVIPDNTDDEGLIQAYKDAEKFGWGKEELIAYDNASIAIQDARGKISAAEKRGKIEGKIEVIKRCYEQNFAVEVIASIVGYTVEEVQRIIKILKNK